MTTEQDRNCLKHQFMKEPTATPGIIRGSPGTKTRSNEEAGRKRRFLKDKKVRWSPLQPRVWTDDVADEVFFNSAALEVEQEAQKGPNHSQTQSRIPEPYTHEHYERFSQSSAVGLRLQQAHAAPKGQHQKYSNPFHLNQGAHLNEPFYQKIHPSPQKAQTSLGSKDQEITHAEKQSHIRTVSTSKVCPASPTTAPHLPSPHKDILASPSTPDEGYSTGTNSTTSISSPLSASLASIGVFDYNSPHHPSVYDNSVNSSLHYPNVSSTYPFNTCQSQCKQYCSPDPAVSHQPYPNQVLENIQGEVRNSNLRVLHKDQSRVIGSIVPTSPTHNYRTEPEPINTYPEYQHQPIQKQQSRIQSTTTPIMPHGPIKKGPSLHPHSRRSGGTSGSVPLLIGVKRRDTITAAKRDINSNNNNIDSFNNHNRNTNSNGGYVPEQPLSSIEDRLRALTTIEEEELNVNSQLQNASNIGNQSTLHNQERIYHKESNTAISEDKYSEPKQSPIIEQGGFTNQNNWSQDQEIEATGFFRAVPVQICQSDLSPHSPGRSQAGDILFPSNNYLPHVRQFDDNAAGLECHGAQDYINNDVNSHSDNLLMCSKSSTENDSAADETFPKNTDIMYGPVQFRLSADRPVHNDFIGRINDRSGLKDYESYFQKEIDIPAHNIDLSKQIKFVNTDQEDAQSTNPSEQLQSWNIRGRLDERNAPHHSEFMQPPHGVEIINGRNRAFQRNSSSKTRYSISREDDRLVLFPAQSEFPSDGNGTLQISQQDGFRESNNASRNTEASIQKIFPKQNQQGGSVVGSMSDLRTQQQLGRSQRPLDGCAIQHNSSLDIAEHDNAAVRLYPHSINAGQLLGTSTKTQHNSLAAVPLSEKDQSSHIDGSELEEDQAILRRSSHRYSWNPSSLENWSRDTRQAQRSSLDLASLPQLQRQIRATSELCLQASRRHKFASSADIYKLFSGGHTKRKPNSPIEPPKPHYSQPSSESFNPDFQPKHFHSLDLNREHKTTLRHSFHAPSNAMSLYAKLGSDKASQRFSASLPSYSNFQNLSTPHQADPLGADPISHHCRQRNQYELSKTDFHPQQRNQGAYLPYQSTDINSLDSPIKRDHSVAVPQFEPQYSLPGYRPSSLNLPPSNRSSLDGLDKYLTTPTDQIAATSYASGSSATAGSNNNMNINELHTNLLRQSSGYSSESELQQIESDAQAVKRHVLTHKRKTAEGKTHKHRPHPLAEAPNPNHEFVALNTSADHDSTTTAGTEDTNNIEDCNLTETVIYRRQTASAEPVYANQIMFGRGGDLTSGPAATKSGMSGVEDPPPPPLPARRYRPASVATESFNAYLPTQMTKPILSQTATVEGANLSKDPSVPIYYSSREAPLLFGGKLENASHDPNHLSMSPNTKTRNLQPKSKSSQVFDAQLTNQFYEEEQYETPTNIDYTEFIADRNGLTDLSRHMDDNGTPALGSSQFSGSLGFTQNQIINIQRRPVTITSHIPTNLFRNTSENKPQLSPNRANTLVPDLPEQDTSPKSPVEIAQLLEVPFSTNIISGEQGDRLSTLV